MSHLLDKINLFFGNLWYFLEYDARSLFKIHLYYLWSLTVYINELFFISNASYHLKGVLGFWGS